MEEQVDEMMREIIRESLTHDVDTCSDDECLVCGYLLCPYKTIEHCFHDGCPTCTLNEREEEKEEMLEDKVEDKGEN
jgi:hypothetical protein